MKAILAILLVGACRPLPPPSPTPLPVVADACSAACIHLRELHCPDGDPTDQGATCETMCAHDLDMPQSGLTQKYLACLSTIPSCPNELKCPH